MSQKERWQVHCGAMLFKEWGAYRDATFEYKKGETWDRLLHQGIHLLETFARHDRIRIQDPQNDLQIKEVGDSVWEASLSLIWTRSVKWTGYAA